MEILNLIVTGVKLFSNAVLFLVFEPFVWIALIIAYRQYSKGAEIQKKMYGNKVKYSTRDMFSTSVLFGILAGFAATIIMTVVGITFKSFNGLQYLIILSLLLMLINQRYICFSYSGGILSLIILGVNDLINSGVLRPGNTVVSFITSNFNFDVPALMMLIAIMHLTESILMWLDGHRGAIPVFMKRGKELVGAFIMQRVWVIPIMLFVLYTGAVVSGETTPTPDWWPLIKPGISKDLLKDAVFTAAVLPAVLGYGDFAVTTTPRKKARRSAKWLFGFSIALFILSILAIKYHIFNYAAAIFAPLAHEALILMERYRENTGTPYIKYSKGGVVVLDTIPDTPSEKMGLMPGDLILTINNVKVNTILDIEEILKEYISYIWADVKTPEGEIRTLEYGNIGGSIDRLGVVTVPAADGGITIMAQGSEKFDGFLKRIIKRK